MAQQDRPRQHSSNPGNGREGYELGAPTSSAERKDLELIERVPRWCPACGNDLTLIDEPPCPRCERPFIPGDTSTYSDEPIEVKHAFWLTSPRIAGAFFVITFLIGRATINGSGSEWAGWMQGTGGQFGVIPGVMLCLLLIPWLVITALLGLTAMGEYYNPKMVYCLLIGGVLGLVLCLGFTPMVLLVGMLTGLFAGYLRCWLARL